MINNAIRSGAVSEPKDLEKRARRSTSERSGKSPDSADEPKVGPHGREPRQRIVVVNGKLTIITE